jgi:PST family polysaccharide transporter
MGSRAIGLVGTLIITRFIAPAEYGEVMVAAVLGMTANQLSIIGWGQYLVAHPQAPRSTVFHVTAFHIGLGVLALAVLLLCGRSLGLLFDAPGMARYLPALSLSVLLDRLAFVPERILVRELRFGRLSIARTAGDLVHSLCSISLAALGFGGAAIVAGNVARSLVRLSINVASVERRDGREAARLDRVVRVRDPPLGQPARLALLRSGADRHVQLGLQPGGCARDSGGRADRRCAAAVVRADG